MRRALCAPPHEPVDPSSPGAGLLHLCDGSQLRSGACDLGAQPRHVPGPVAPALPSPPHAGWRGRVGKAESVAERRAPTPGEHVGVVPPAPGCEEFIAAEPCEQWVPARCFELRQLQERVRRIEDAMAPKHGRREWPKRSISPPSTSRTSHSRRPRWRITRSCHADSSAIGAFETRRVTGTGSDSPSRRATRVAAASTLEESRPPEKLTRHGARWSAGRMASSSAAIGDRPRPSRWSSPRDSWSSPYILPEATSSASGRRGWGSPEISTRGRPVGRAEALTHSCRRMPRTLPPSVLGRVTENSTSASIGWGSRRAARATCERISLRSASGVVTATTRT